MSVSQTLLVLLPGRPEWKEEDGAALRAFLITPTGKLLTQTLLSARPEVTGTDREARMIKSDERAGFEACIAEIMALAEPKS